jgi:hypothetical protein
VTRNKRPNRLTIEKFASNSLDVRELRRRRILGDAWVEIGPSLRWLRIACMRVARYRIIIQLWKQATPQNIRVSWTKCHLGGLRPWMHCPYCEKRVAKLYRGLGGYFCRATLRRKIGAEVGICSSIEKPKGMHRREGSGHRAIPRRFTLRSIAKPISLSRREGVRPHFRPRQGENLRGRGDRRGALRSAARSAKKKPSIGPARRPSEASTSAPPNSSRPERARCASW